MVSFNLPQTKTKSRNLWRLSFLLLAVCCLSLFPNPSVYAQNLLPTFSPPSGVLPLLTLPRHSTHSLKKETFPRYLMSSNNRMSGLGRLTQRQTAPSPDLLTASIILLVPTTIAELTIFIGNLISFSNGKHRLAWGLQGMGFSLLGGLISLPWIIEGLASGYAIPFLAMHILLLGVGVTNVIQDSQARKVDLVPWFFSHPQTGNQGGVALIGKF